MWKGPLVILEVLSPVLFKVANQRNAYAIHHDRLKVCDVRNIPLWLSHMRNQALNNESRECKPPEKDTEDMNLGWLYSDMPLDIKSPAVTGRQASSQSDPKRLPQIPEDDPNTTSKLPPPSPKEPPKTTRTGRETRKPSYISEYSI